MNAYRSVNNIYIHIYSQIHVTKIISDNGKALLHPHKNRSPRVHVLTGNECYTITIVYVIVGMLLQWALTMNAFYALEPTRIKTRWQVL